MRSLEHYGIPKIPILGQDLSGSMFFQSLNWESLLGWLKIWTWIIDAPAIGMWSLEASPWICTEQNAMQGTLCDFQQEVEDGIQLHLILWLLLWGKARCPIRSPVSLSLLCWRILKIHQLGKWAALGRKISCAVPAEADCNSMKSLTENCLA